MSLPVPDASTPARAQADVPPGGDVFANYARRITSLLCGSADVNGGRTMADWERFLRTTENAYLSCSNTYHQRIVAAHERLLRCQQAGDNESVSSGNQEAMSVNLQQNSKKTPNEVASPDGQSQPPVEPSSTCSDSELEVTSTCDAAGRVGVSTVCDLESMQSVTSGITRTSSRPASTVMSTDLNSRNTSVGSCSSVHAINSSDGGESIESDDSESGSARAMYDTTENQASESTESVVSSTTSTNTPSGQQQGQKRFLNWFRNPWHSQSRGSGVATMGMVAESIASEEEEEGDDTSDTTPGGTAGSLNHNHHHQTTFFLLRPRRAPNSPSNSQPHPQTQPQPHPRRRHHHHLRPPRAGGGGFKRMQPSPSSASPMVVDSDDLLLMGRSAEDDEATSEVTELEEEEEEEDTPGRTEEEVEEGEEEEDDGSTLGDQHVPSSPTGGFPDYGRGSPDGLSSGQTIGSSSQSLSSEEVVIIDDSDPEMQGILDGPSHEAVLLHLERQEQSRPPSPLSLVSTSDESSTGPSWVSDSPEEEEEEATAIALAVSDERILGMLPAGYHQSDDNLFGSGGQRESVEESLLRQLQAGHQAGHHPSERESEWMRAHHPVPHPLPEEPDLPSGSAPYLVTTANVISALECPVCFTYMRAPIWLCVNGHNVCGRCQQRVFTCPVCRGRLLYTRNLALETIAADIGFQQQTQQASPSETTKLEKADMAVDSKEKEDQTPQGPTSADVPHPTPVDGDDSVVGSADAVVSLNAEHQETVGEHGVVSEEISNEVHMEAVAELVSDALSSPRPKDSVVN